MARALSALIAILLVVGVFLLPKGDQPRLAALHVFSLIGGDSTENVEGEEVDLWALFKETPAFEVTGEGQAKFLLGGARLIGTAEDPGDLLVHGELRNALIRGINQAATKDGTELRLVGKDGAAVYGLNFLLEVEKGELALSWQMPGEEATTELFPWTPPSRESLLPPIIAICLALLIRKPVPALFLGVLAAAFILRRSSGDSVLESTGAGFIDIFRNFFWEQLLKADRKEIILFVVAMLAMVGVVTRNGGIRGIMDSVARFASGVKSTQFATYLMGMVVFFDDYANTILVGGTMRPLTDRFKISREKLAYIVDSTAAPVAGISIFSTWIAFEVSTFSAQLPSVGMKQSQGYEVFIDSLPYRFYSFLTIALVAIVILGGRDFGPMLGAERRARTTGKLVRDGGQPLVSDLATAMKPVEGITIRAFRAVVPLGVFIGMTLAVILYTGGGFDTLFADKGLSSVLAGASSTKALMIGSLSGFGTAAVLSLMAGLRWEILDAAWKTLRSMGIAIVILYLAWMLSEACNQIGTAQYLTVTLGDIEFPMVLPIVLFLLAGAVAFSTGSSWGTMGILLPLVVGLSYSLGSQIAIGSTPAGPLSGHLLMLLSIGAVLEGSIFGDHCSPISDTTVLSSVASASDHIDHVRTQAPYAILSMVVALIAGYMPCAAFGLPPWIALGIGIAVLIVVMRLLGRRAEDPPEKDKRAFG